MILILSWDTVRSGGKTESDVLSRGVDLLEPRSLVVGSDRVEDVEGSQ